MWQRTSVTGRLPRSTSDCEVHLTAFGFGERLFRVAMRLQQHTVLCYGIAIAGFAVALGVRFAVNEALPSGFPYLTFFPAVLLAAFFCGTGPGIVTAVLSVTAAWYWFIAPANSFSLDLQSAVAVLFFVVILAADLLIIHTMRSAVTKFMNEQAKTTDLLERQHTLFEELQHRTANNLSFIGALLGMYKRRSRNQPEAVAAFEDAAMRLNTMAQVHRKLYDPTNIDLPVGSYLNDLLKDVLAGSGATHVRLEVVSRVGQIDIDRLITLSLFITEVAVNSVKHAFAGRPDGLLRVELSGGDGGQYVVTIRDDGPGLPDGFDPDASDRLGMRVLRSFARTLGGTLVFRSEKGAVTELSFPATSDRAADPVP